MKAIHFAAPNDAAAAVAENLRSPASEAAHKAARDRVLEGVRRLEALGAMSTGPTDLRYVIEMQALMLETLLTIMVEKGLCTYEMFDVLDLAFVQARADQLERRVHAALDGQKDLPR